MGGQQDGALFAAEVLHQFVDFQARLRIEAGRRLIEEQHRRIERHGAGGGFEVLCTHQLIDESERQSFIGAHALAGEHELHRRAHADDAHRAHRPAEPRVNAKLHFGKSEREGLVIHSDAIATGKRKLESPAQCETVNGRDACAGQRLQPIKDALSCANQSKGVLWALERRELVDVGAGDKATGFRGANDERTGHGHGEVADDRAQLYEHLAREHIRRGAGLIQSKPHHPVSVAIELPVGEGVHALDFT